MKKHGNGRQGRGHFCWCCGEMLPNEKFSGRNHSRHLCRGCSKLGKSELEYRQEVRNLECLLTWDEIIPRKQRKAFEKFLSHPNPRVRERARELAALDVEARKLNLAEQALWQGDEMDDAGMDEFAELDDSEPVSRDSTGGSRPSEDDDLPF